ncbi:MAG: DUF2610 domain-containing protein [Rhodospirillaceae bacterium]|nr:DUF2610 domain-containing protein [Rhodospirillaceae bacterium]
MRLIALTLAAAACSAALAPRPAPAQMLLGQISDCFRLAGFPADPNLPEGVDGVPITAIEADAAISACAQALELVAPDHPSFAQIQYQLGRALHAAGRGAEAAEAYEDAAEAGYVLGYNNLGFLYQFGAPDLPAEPERALSYFQQAADAGSAAGLYNLAIAYRNGVGTPENGPRALELFRQAGEAGIMDAYRDMALLMESGSGTLSADPSGAATVWREAAAAGDAQSAFNLAQRIRDGWALATAPGEMLALYRQAADGGVVQAALDLSAILANANSADFAPEEALDYAYLALDLNRDADPGIGSAWPVFRNLAARRIITLIDQQDLRPRDAAELDTLRADYGADPETVSLTIDCEFIGPQTIDIYLWDWDRDEPPPIAQLDWLRASGTCQVPDVLYDGVHEVYDTAQANQASFVETMLNVINGVDPNATGPTGPTGPTDQPTPDTGGLDPMPPELASSGTDLPLRPNMMFATYSTELLDASGGSPPRRDAAQPTGDRWGVTTGGTRASVLGNTSDNRSIAMTVDCDPDDGWGFVVRFFMTEVMNEAPFHFVVSVVDVASGSIVGTMEVTPDTASDEILRVLDGAEALALLRMVQEASSGFAVGFSIEVQALFTTNGSRQAIANVMAACGY